MFTEHKASVTITLRIPLHADVFSVTLPATGLPVASKSFVSKNTHVGDAGQLFNTLKPQEDRVYDIATVVTIVTGAQ